MRGLIRRVVANLLFKPFYHALLEVKVNLCRTLFLLNIACIAQNESNQAQRGVVYSIGNL